MCLIQNIYYCTLMYVNKQLKWAIVSPVILDLIVPEGSVTFRYAVQ